LPRAEFDALLAEELNVISDKMEQLGMRLCEQDEVVQRCLHDLQEIDRLAQQQRQIAQLIGSKECALDQINLEYLRDRIDLAIHIRQNADKGS